MVDCGAGVGVSGTAAVAVEEEDWGFAIGAAGVWMGVADLTGVDGAAALLDPDALAAGAAFGYGFGYIVSSHHSKL